MISQKILDKEIKHPVADFCTLGNKLIASSYDFTLRVYENNTLESFINTPCVYTKICEFQSKIVGISYSSGILSVFDSELNVISNMSGFTNPCLIMPFANYLLLGTMNNEVFILEKNLDFSEINFRYFKIHSVINKDKRPTALASYKSDYFAISFQNTICIFNSKFEEIFSKQFSICISSLSFYSENIILLGLLNGKIQVENIEDSDDSFMFNSHFSYSENKKILYPVTYLQSSRNSLLSSGYEGKLIKWNLDQKKMLLTAINCQKFIRKFLNTESNIYLLIEDDSKNTLYVSESIASFN